MQCCTSFLILLMCALERAPPHELRIFTSPNTLQHLGWFLAHTDSYRIKPLRPLVASLLPTLSEVGTTAKLPCTPRPELQRKAQTYPGSLWQNRG